MLELYSLSFHFHTINQNIQRCTHIIWRIGLGKQLLDKYKRFFHNGKAFSLLVTAAIIVSYSTIKKIKIPREILGSHTHHFQSRNISDGKKVYTRYCSPHKNAHIHSSFKITLSHQCNITLNERVQLICSTGRSMVTSHNTNSVCISI
jgi:hypothetical protein